MATKIEKLQRQLNANFSGIVKEHMKNRFNIDVETRMNLDLQIFTSRVDGVPFTVEQKAYLEAFDHGYGACMRQVHD